MPRTEAGQSDGMLTHGEWLGERGQVGVQCIGHRKEKQLLQHHVLGQRARVGVRVADLFHAGRAQKDG